MTELMSGTGFPLHLSLTGRRVVAVGGGPVAARKVASCLAAGADVLVVAPYACELIVADAAAGLLDWQQRDYQQGDLDGAWLVVAATGDRVTDETVEADATAQRTFCVRADDAAAGSARTPATLRRDDLVISVASSGTGGTADPGRSVAVRNAIAQALDAGTLPLRRHRPAGGHVVLVGGGPGEKDLLTLRARRELAAADVVVVDRLAPLAVLDELGPEVLVIDVGKTRRGDEPGHPRRGDREGLDPGATSDQRNRPGHRGAGARRPVACGDRDRRGRSARRVTRPGSPVRSLDRLRLERRQGADQDGQRDEPAPPSGRSACARTTRRPAARDLPRRCVATTW